MSVLSLNLRPTFALSYDQNKHYASCENVSLLFHILLIEIPHHTNKLIWQSLQHFLSYTLRHTAIVSFRNSSANGPIVSASPPNEIAKRTALSKSVLSKKAMIDSGTEP